MADRPTCRVVKGYKGKGARIFPKGCKVNKFPSENRPGKVVSKTKTGMKKRIIDVMGDHYGITLEQNGYSKRFMYDTGATTVLMDKRTAKRFKIMNEDGTYNYTGIRIQQFEDANKVITEGAEVPDVPFNVQVRDKDTGELVNVAIRTRVGITDTGVSLFGVSGIRKLKEKGVSFKVKNPSVVGTGAAPISIGKMQTKKKKKINKKINNKKINDKNNNDKNHYNFNENKLLIHTKYQYDF